MSKALAGKRILIVEDEDIFTADPKRALDGVGAEVVARMEDLCAASTT